MVCTRLASWASALLVLLLAKPGSAAPAPDHINGDPLSNSGLRGQAPTFSASLDVTGGYHGLQHPEPGDNIRIADGGGSSIPHATDLEEGHGRSLLHSCHTRSCTSLCPRCRVPRLGSSTSWGHCRTNTRLYSCRRNWSRSELIEQTPAYRDWDPAVVDYDNELQVSFQPAPPAATRYDSDLGPPHVLPPLPAIQTNTEAPPPAPPPADMRASPERDVPVNAGGTSASQGQGPGEGGAEDRAETEIVIGVEGDGEGTTDGVEDEGGPVPPGPPGNSGGSATTALFQSSFEFVPGQASTVRFTVAQQPNNQGTV